MNLAGEVVKDGDNIVKGIDLSGKDKLLFLVDTSKGRLVCKPNPKTIELNSSLHKND